MSPETNGARPITICCTEALTLMKLPRWCGAALAEIIAIPGTQRIDVTTMNSVVASNVSATGESGDRFVTRSTGTTQNTPITRNTSSLSRLSATQPVGVIVSSVATPPTTQTHFTL